MTIKSPVLLILAWATAGCSFQAPITLHWAQNMLTVSHARIPGQPIVVNYLEAYCRPGSTDRDWHSTVIPHQTRLVFARADGRRIKLQCTLNDGVIVNHLIHAHEDHVAFDLTAHNPTDQRSEAHWVQPCIRLDRFIRKDKRSYIENCFVVEGGKLARMPTKDWATEARYTPGQVWAAPGVDRSDVNPRPLNPHTAERGLIGAFNHDESWVMATAWEPYQELFQGVITCVHSDFRIGGLTPGQTKTARGTLYFMPADEKKLLRRYARDFPEHNPTTLD